MDIKLEILSWAISDVIKNSIEHISIDTSDTINSIALIALTEIQSIITDEKITDDFEVVEEIVNIFEKYNINASNRHDFS